MEALFRDYWWLIFPVFGMLMALKGDQTANDSQKDVLDLIKTYADQGRSPPPELLRLVQKSGAAR